MHGLSLSSFSRAFGLALFQGPAEVLALLPEPGPALFQELAGCWPFFKDLGADPFSKITCRSNPFSRVLVHQEVPFPRVPHLTLLQGLAVWMLFLKATSEV